MCLGLSGIYSLPVLVKYASRLFPCSSHHPQEFLNLEGRNPFYPAKKAEPGIFRIPDVFFTPEQVSQLRSALPGMEGMSTSEVLAKTLDFLHFARARSGGDLFTEYLNERPCQ